MRHVVDCLCVCVCVCVCVWVVEKMAQDVEWCKSISAIFKGSIPTCTFFHLKRFILCYLYVFSRDNRKWKENSTWIAQHSCANRQIFSHICLTTTQNQKVLAHYSSKGSTLAPHTDVNYTPKFEVQYLLT